MNKYITLLSAAVLLLAGCINESAKKVEILDEYAGAKTKVTMAADPIPAEGGTLVATVSTEVPFEVSLAKTATWLTAAKSSDQITFTATANPSAEKRWTSIVLVDPDTHFAITSFDVVQAGTEKVVVIKKFYVSTEELAALASQTESSFSVTAEVPWTAVSDNADFTVSPASGDGDALVKITYPANTVTEQKIVHITVATTAEDVQTQSYTIVLTQEAGKEVSPAVKPAPGTVLAEWEFETAQAEALRAGGFEKVSAEEDNAIGNGGSPYVPSNVSGKGRLEYYNGIDKTAKSTKKNKSRIGERGEPCIYCVWVGDSILWTAEIDAPLAAGTKFKLNFALRPNTGTIMKYWQCEFLDGDEWKALGEPIVLEYHASAAGTAEDPKQINCLIEKTATLTKDTPCAQFRFTSTQNAQCGDGSPLEALTGDALRFAGKWLEASAEQQYLQVPENPKIVVVE